MKIGICGLGKVGLPLALALAVHGRHEVTGYDVSPVPGAILAGTRPPWREEGMEELLRDPAGKITMASSPEQLVKAADLIIVAVPTPHPDGYGGEIPAPEKSRDFDYGYLVTAVRDICAAARKLRKTVTVSVLSTVLPGTMRREIVPLGNSFTRIAYSPAFISLGTVISNFTYPEFILLGASAPGDSLLMEEAWRAIAHSGAEVRCSFETAEVAKMAYNMYGSVRITFANMLAELCDRTGADCEAAARTVFSMDGPVNPGMPDGGPCRPRDLIALSWLAEETCMSFNLPRAVMRAREAHAEWLAGRIRKIAELRGLPVIILGAAYKPESDITDGSPSMLLAHYLQPDEIWEPAYKPEPDMPVAVYVAAVRHRGMPHWKFPPGSAVVDPWGFMPDDGDVPVIRPGRR